MSFALGIQSPLWLSCSRQKEVIFLYIISSRATSPRPSPDILWGSFIVVRHLLPPGLTSAGKRSQILLPETAFLSHLDPFDGADELLPEVTGNHGSLLPQPLLRQLLLGSISQGASSHSGWESQRSLWSGNSRLYFRLSNFMSQL